VPRWTQANTPNCFHGGGGGICVFAESDNVFSILFNLFISGSMADLHVQRVPRVETPLIAAMIFSKTNKPEHRNCGNPRPEVPEYSH
jgi:hypothetical protein